VGAHDQRPSQRAEHNAWIARRLGDRESLAAELGIDDSGSKEAGDDDE
jgi:hypothetical protein